MNSNSNVDTLAQNEPPNQIKISFAFDRTNAQIQTLSFIDLDKISESDSITENISNILRKSLLDFFKTDPKKLELALEKNSENDFLEALSHYQEDDPNVRQQIYSLVNQSLKQKSWKKSYLKILVRTGLLAENSNDFNVAKGYLKEALKLKMDDDTRVGITLSYANSYAKEGHLDTAIQIYKSVLDSSLKKVGFENIAWCHNNLGASLIKNKRIDEGVIHYREAARIRENNNKIGEPFRTLGILARSLELLDIQCSLSLYDEICTTLHNDISSSEIIRNRAHAHYGAARLRCLELGAYKEALKDVNDAIPLLQHFIEDRDCLAGALNIKQICLDKMGISEELEETIKKRDTLLAALPTLESALLDKNSEDIDNDRIKRKIEIIKNIEELGNIPENELQFFIEEQIDILEKDTDSSARIAQAYLLSFYGENLIKKSKYPIAIDYFSRAKALYPSFIKNNILLSMALYKNQNYSEAIQFSLDLARKHPTVSHGFYIAGLSAYKISDYNLAEQMFESAIKLDPNLDQISDYLENTKLEIREQRILGVQQISNYKADIFPSTHDRFLDYLQGFKSRCQKNADAFWKSYSNQEYVQNPENIGRALLVQDLQALVSNANIYKETVLAGGRIDLIINILGSEFIVELKICGNGYSKTYAEGGFEQLKSYMSVRDAKRSYLVIFDARIKQDGVNSLPKEYDLDDGKIAFCIGVDIRSMK
ncbi:MULTISPECIES: tetratricopeptide repeat protein [Acinetobacter]|uniref:tetratricopeptide repeat protein n=2 Tax=Moraxellaceae TaxID=468 RepID=UPI0007433017|nr:MULTISPECIES: hypothetical protein [Acinetobacter calcoaceticus/baumannii complex]EHU2434062.1 hypothetical protein [Acinetobacter baumannii]EIB6924220.1 hypothetical protein [Acinetobacter baumannii]MCU4586767.1 hypothetical protein [Acinetobacter nosocomialis]OTT96426.1 hypothetical protein CAT70_00015 [Acinetobacter baumannii]WCE36385.1 hypothetical protein PIG43_19645 [Acinetobacter baumannii]